MLKQKAICSLQKPLGGKESLFWIRAANILQAYYNSIPCRAKFIRTLKQERIQGDQLLKDRKDHC